MKALWRDFHVGELVIDGDRQVRKFPSTSSWFEILAALREAIKDMGNKLWYQKELEMTQQNDSDLGTDNGKFTYGDEGSLSLKTLEEEKLELVFSDFVDLKNNGAR